MKLDLEKMKQEKEIKKLQEEINNLDIKKRKYQMIKKYKFYPTKKFVLGRKFLGQVISEIIYFYYKILQLLIVNQIKLVKI